MLIDHWHAGRGQEALSDRSWNQVLLQDASWATLFPAADFDAVAANWVRLAQQHGAKPSLIVTWARDGHNPMYRAVPIFNGNRDLMQGVVTRRYADTAERLGVDTVPVGPAWRLAWDRDDLPDLFHPDGNHSTPTSQWLTALTIYHYLCEAPGAPPFEVLPSSLAPHAETLWQAARAARDREALSIANRSEIDAIALSETKALQ
ncbi:MAG: hypothetical protein AAF556_07940 [Pseudomonadota bacterium]